MMTTDLLARFRLAALKPAYIQPRFKTVEELMEWHRNEELKTARAVTIQNRQRRLEKIIGRSGICPLHKDCTFANYTVECEGQGRALDAARTYATEFGKTHGGFIFSGSVGTGKNHLATAIAKYLIKRNKTAMIITVSELLTNFRATFDKGSAVKESALMKDICGLDLLVLDEVGLQKGSEWEINLLTQIVDRRQLQLKPTGMLTNCTEAELMSILRERIMDRQLSGGVWVEFNWPSQRSKTRGKKA
ncbi:ATP-binding protein [Sodalis ligni]|uniref:DNA replication protein DnaC/putative replication protein n=1 Tax=Sodalis ligni TaxID=2697027 RepID=A0A4R1NGN9_9GAMM|nr:ATP-binding protein [Sodalis ligni]TCL06865.1 DNA replication protein DnaC/putative replication protein [Sodalis ligni]